jgi:hypothetical protein
MADETVDRKPTAADVAKTLREDNKGWEQSLKDGLHKVENKVVDAVDGVVNPNKDAHPIARGAMDAVADVGKNVNDSLKASAADARGALKVIADEIYFRTHPQEPGAERKVSIADGKIDKALDRGLDSVPLVKDGKDIVAALADKEYFSKHPSEPGAQQKVQDAEYKLGRGIGKGAFDAAETGPQGVQKVHTILKDPMGAVEKGTLDKAAGLGKAPVKSDKDGSASDGKLDGAKTAPIEPRVQTRDIPEGTPPIPPDSHP